MVLIFTAPMLSFAFYEGDHAPIAGMAFDCARNIFNFILVAALICNGRSKRYIAEHLFISENTVKTHARRLCEKLGVHGRQELLDLIGAEVTG